MTCVKCAWLCLRAWLTWTGGDVTLLVFLRRSQAGLTSVPGLRVGAGPLAAADAPAAVPAALGPGAPGRPAAVHRVARDPAQTKHLPCGVQRGGQTEAAA